MFEFEQTDYGLKLTARGALGLSDVSRLRADLERLLEKRDGPFSALVDCREYIPVDDETTRVLQLCEKMALKGGMQRMAFILKSPVVEGQVRQIGHLSGTAGITRYIDASKVDNAVEVALRWLVDGIEPEAANNPTKSEGQSIRP